MTATITNVGAMRRLIVGLWTRQYQASSTEGTRLDVADLKGYTAAAHIALEALGADVPPAPFGLQVIVYDAVLDAGPRPPGSATTALPIWRERLTDAIVEKIT